MTRNDIFNTLETLQSLQLFQCAFVKKTDNKTLCTYAVFYVSEFNQHQHNAKPLYFRTVDANNRAESECEAISEELKSIFDAHYSEQYIVADSLDMLAETEKDNQELGTSERFGKVVFYSDLEELNIKSEKAFSGTVVLYANSEAKTDESFLGVVVFYDDDEEQNTQKDFILNRSSS